MGAQTRARARAHSSTPHPWCNIFACQAEDTRHGATSLHARQRTSGIAQHLACQAEDIRHSAPSPWQAHLQEQGLEAREGGAHTQVDLLPCLHSSRLIGIRYPCKQADKRSPPCSRACMLRVRAMVSPNPVVMVSPNPIAQAPALDAHRGAGMTLTATHARLSGCSASNHVPPCLPNIAETSEPRGAEPATCHWTSHVALSQPRVTGPATWR